MTAEPLVSSSVWPTIGQEPRATRMSMADAGDEPFVFAARGRERQLHEGDQIGDGLYRFESIDGKLDLFDFLQAKGDEHDVEWKQGEIVLQTMSILYRRDVDAEMLRDSVTNDLIGKVFH
jgi:hypothetical protein